MDDAAALHEIEAIKQLKARYCRYLDDKDWDQWRRLFDDDFDERHRRDRRQADDRCRCVRGVHPEKHRQTDRNERCTRFTPRRSR